MKPPREESKSKWVKHSKELAEEDDETIDELVRELDKNRGS